jgi:hypothetical protein
MLPRIHTLLVSAYFTLRAFLELRLLTLDAPSQQSMYIHGAAASACDILITASQVFIFRVAGSHSTRR